MVNYYSHANAVYDAGRIDQPDSEIVYGRYYSSWSGVQLLTRNLISGPLQVAGSVGPPCSLQTVAGGMVDALVERLCL